MKPNELEVKSQVLNELLDSGKLIAEVAEDYGLSRRLVYSWVKVSRQTKTKTSKPKSTRVNRSKKEQTSSSYLANVI